MSHLKKKTRFCDDVSSAASSDNGSIYMPSDSDMEPEVLESETEDLNNETEEAPEPEEQKEKNKDDAFRWFPAT